MSSSSPLALLPLALRLADAARLAIAPHFRAPGLAAENKAGTGFDPVTAADRAAEQAMRALIERERPQDGVEGEEFGSKPAGESRFTWYLDPIDGTRAFIAGLPTWTVLIGLVEAGRPVLGVIDQPWLDERYVGCEGKAWVAERGRQATLAVSPCPALTDALLATTDYFLFTPPERGAFDHVRATARMTRYGLDAYAYARLAAGGLHMVIESGLQPHDVAALAPVVEGAGGVIADWRGRPIRLGGGDFSGQIVAAAHQDVLDEALISLRRSAY